MLNVFNSRTIGGPLPPVGPPVTRRSSSHPIVTPLSPPLLYGSRRLWVCSRPPVHILNKPVILKQWQSKLLSGSHTTPFPLPDRRPRDRNRIRQIQCIFLFDHEELPLHVCILQAKFSSWKQTDKSFASSALWWLVTSPYVSHSKPWILVMPLEWVLTFKYSNSGFPFRMLYLPQSHNL